MALLVVSVVVSVGLTLVDITLKQLRLATGAKDSEAAFHAATAGVECVRYWRRQLSDQIEDGLTLPGVSCFGSAPANINRTSLDPQPPDPIYRYELEFTWSGRCTKATLVSMKSPFNLPLTLRNVPSAVPGHPGYQSGVDKECEPGGRCTIMSVQGYNRSCSNINSFGTVQREVLLEL